ncbi:response regulator [Reyranella sp.]|uniref:response regulator n=1 Tax=Reyranella sp. TaxID=1929291 RepID=UPI003783FECA
MTRELILNVDDTDSGRYIKSRILRQGGYDVVEARTGVEALEKARHQKPDLVLLDVKLPDVSGHEVCRVLKKSAVGLLVLQISASFVAPGDRAVGLDSGADAYLSQPVEPSELLATVRALLRLKRAERAARESNELYRVIVESAVDYAIITSDLEGRVKTWSDGAQLVLGWTADSMVGQPLDRLFLDEDVARHAPALERTMATDDGRTTAERWLRRSDGRRIWTSATVVPLRADMNGVKGFIHILRDRTSEKAEQDAMQRSNEVLEREVAARTRALTDSNAKLRQEIEERERAEQALRQVEKLEAIGQLTGGIAHDFNNMLTVVLGAAEALKKALPGNATSQQRRADLIMQAAAQAAALTHRLLAFSRPQPHDPKPANLNAQIGGVLDMLRRTIGESVDIVTELEAGLPLISVDSNQLENAILNLAVNARDAMSGNGTLTIRTFSSGRAFVSLAIADTGVGMTPEVAAHAFEPFFTTKRTGEGTGLGLAQVMSFVQQSGAMIHVDSTPNAGTAIEMRFPALAEGTAHAGTTGDQAPSEFRGAGRKALVVEDQQGVREFVADALGRLGFEVATVGDADAALRFIDSDEPIDLLMTDIGLPGRLDGWQLASLITKRLPATKVVFMTGYATSPANTDSIGEGRVLLMKPFTQAALETRLVRLFGT